MEVAEQPRGDSGGGPEEESAGAQSQALSSPAVLQPGAATEESDARPGETPGGYAAPSPAPPLTTPAPPALPVRAHARAEGLPAVAPAADLASRRVPWYWALVCFLVTFLVYAAFVPHFLLFSNPPTGDQAFYLMDTISLVNDRDIELTNNYARHDEDYFYTRAPHPTGYVGMTAPYPLPAMLANATARPQNEQYSFHLPGLAVWLIPAWIVGGWFELWWPATIIFMCALGALLALNVFLFSYELTGKMWIAWAVWLPVAFTSPVMTYSYLIFTELPTGLLAIYALRRLALGWGANGPLRLALVGFCIGYIPWLAWRCVPIAAFLALYAAVQWWRYRRALKEPSPAPDAPAMPRKNPGTVLSGVWLAAPLLALAASIGWYNIFLFGRLIPDSSLLEQGRTAIFHWPWMGLDNAILFVSGMFGQLFDIQFGLFTYAPFYLLAVVGAIAMWRSPRAADRRILFWMGLVMLPYVLIICSFDSWNGVWCPPARYITSFVPFMGGLLAFSLYTFTRSRLGRAIYPALYALLAVPGFLLMAVMMNDARLFWPGDFGAPFGWLAVDQSSPVRGFDLRGVLPSFIMPSDVKHPAQSAMVVSAAAGIILLCFLLLLAQETRRGPRRQWPFAAQGATWAVALAAVGAGWFLINYYYLTPRTQLEQVAQWTIPAPLVEPYGIAYFQGKVYLTQYNRQGAGGLAAFDPETAAYQPIAPTFEGQPAAYAHPSDVKVGPDGFLYLLNNGPEADAMWVMRPTGEIIRKIALQYKSNIATGFNFGPDGNIYVADMLGGRVLKYAPAGNEPMGMWGGDKGGFNNVAGVAVTPNNMVFAAELGFGLVQQLNTSGTFLRNYDIRCKPVHAAVSGDFVDVTCNSGLVSINWKEQRIQLPSYTGGDATRLVSPTGITYGPGNTMFVLDQMTLREYSVKR